MLLDQEVPRPALLLKTYLPKSRPPRSPLDAEARLQALKRFLLLPDAGVLTAINKRIANILRKAPPGAILTVQAAALKEEAELALHRVLEESSDSVHQAITERRYVDALTALTGLRAAVDDFFERILVMDENLTVRHNRLAFAEQCPSAAGWRRGPVATARLTAPMQAIRSLLFTTYMMVSACVFGAFMSLCFWAPYRFPIRRRPVLGTVLVLGIGAPLRFDVFGREARARSQAITSS